MLRQRKPLFILLSGFVLLTLFLLSADLRAVQSQQVAPAAPEDYVYGDWQTASNSPFAYARFDAEYSQDTGMVYVLGGRLPDGETDGSIWEFDPVTGTYTDTGVDMPVPISNYQIAAVDDSGTEVFMVFGGRPAAGGVTDAVQGYIPSSNTTVNFTATDPYPVATSPGGSVTVDNLVYSFGGFDAVAVIPDTYIFDISASDGNRFSTGPDLNLGRSYIAATAVDGYIYAIGGDTFDGASLIPQTIAERLDTSNPAAWDDASVADLPIACEATPAFGFEPGSDYDLAGAIVLAGCGQWPNESVEAQIYDIASDTWDTAFHDLNEARRNHAGAFIPTGDGTGGFPGMWVWGGIQEADSNLLTIPEYYQVTPLDDFTLVPQEQFHAAFEAVTVNMGAANNSGGSDTFDLTYSDTEGWDITGPATVTVDDGDIVAFTIDVEIPDSADCLDTNVIIVEATGQGDPSLTDTATINIEVACPTGIQGVITDANTGLPLAGAYVYAEYTLDPAIVGEAFTNDEGEYFITEMAPGNYYVAVSAEGYQWSPLPEGWPNGTDLATVVDGELSELDVALNAPVMEWSDSSYTVTAPAGTVVTQTLTISNTGTSDLYVSIGNYDGSIEPPPAVTPARTPGYRIDSRILSHMEIDGTADFIVVMAEQADLSGAYGISDWSARGHYVYDRLLQTAERTQAAIRGQLDSAGISYRPFLANNSIMVYDGDMALVNQLAARSDVAYLMANALVELVEPEFTTPAAPLSPLTWGVQAVNADDVWVDFGVTGQDVIVANIDTGVDWDHPALVQQYRGGPGDHDYNWYMPTTGCPGQTEPCDNDGHGTHTMGTIVGSTDPDDPVNAAQGIGVAPGAQWIACKGCEFNSCSFEALLSCGDWMLAPTDLNGENPDPEQRPHVVNNSWGGGGGDFWYGGVVGAWRASGMFPQFSAGNSGPGCGTTGAPGDYDLSFASGALQDLGGGNYGIAGFSSRGPAAVTGELKPNISAPGVAVFSSLPGGGYGNNNGTSMASPHVAGVVALVWSAQPELIGQIENTMWLLSQTATPILTNETCGGDDPTSHPNHTFGWGIVNAEAAVGEAAGMVIPWLEVSSGGAAIPAGDSIEVDLVFTIPAGPGPYTGTLHLTADEPYSPDVRIPLTVNVGETVYAVDMSGDMAAEGEAGSTVSYTVWVTNTGNTNDTFDLALSGQSWDSALSAGSVSLAPGAGAAVTVEVDIPGGAADGDSDTVTVTATSVGDPSVTASANLTTTAFVVVEEYKTYLPIMLKQP